MTSTQSTTCTKVDSKQKESRQTVLAGANKEWDICVQRAARTVGFGILAGTLIAALAGAGVPVIWGTGISVAWSVKTCRALFRDGIITPEMAKAKKEREKRDREEARKQEQLKRDEQKMKKSKEREERTRAAQSKIATEQSEKDCCKALEEQKKKASCKPNSPKSEETKKKQVESADTAKTQGSSNKKCDVKLTSKSVKGDSVHADPKRDIQVAPESFKQGANPKCGIKSETVNTENLPDLKEQVPNTLQFSCDTKTDETDPKNVQNLTENPQLLGDQPNEQHETQNSSLPVKCSNTENTQDSDVSFEFAPQESSLIFNSDTTVSVSSPRSPTKFTTVLETSGTTCSCVVLGIDENCPHCDEHRLSDKQVNDSSQRACSDVCSVLEDTAEQKISNDESVTYSGMVDDLANNSKSNSLEYELDDEDIAGSENCTEGGPLSYSDAQLSIDDFEDKETCEEDEDDQGLEQTEEIIIFPIEDDSDNEQPLAVDYRHIPALSSNKIGKLDGDDSHTVDKGKPGTWPLPFSLPSLERFQKKSNSSFKWPPLPSSVIVRPKKEPMARTSRKPACDCSSRDKCTCL